MDVNARNYRWSESRSKVCQICDMGEDETLEHVVLECVKSGRYKGLSLEQSRVICNIKIKFKINGLNLKLYKIFSCVIKCNPFFTYHLQEYAIFHKTKALQSRSSAQSNKASWQLDRPAPSRRAKTTHQFVLKAVRYE
ncbi:hypothetical protein E2C01_076391 [Portunus trituberculatus]|uniref:Uncharacterized protein n=1 Tax=Portunus trituberculatus TaxID=210409 RepID=A0A5B7ILX2_PORTR|nr:hypothetical protein [Portunus trituberculatus]